MSIIPIPRTLIIVPAYNEEASIHSTLTNLLKLKTRIPNLDICVVNDGSRDSTSQIVKGFDVIQLQLPLNLGIGGAVQTGYKYAYNNHYEIAVQFDADGQHNVEDLLGLLQPIIKDEADMVVGSRFYKKTSYRGSIARRIGIYYFYGLLKLLTRQSFTDPTSGYRAINAKVIEIFNKSYPKDYPEPEVLILLYRKGLRIKEIAANMQDRQGGVSSITPLRSIYYMSKVTLAILMQKFVRE
jgi:glycosyltransferase involved in cell wall biosynthesis